LLESLADELKIMSPDAKGDYLVSESSRPDGEVIRERLTVKDTIDLSAFLIGLSQGKSIVYPLEHHET